MEVNSLTSLSNRHVDTMDHVGLQSGKLKCDGASHEVMRF